MLETDSREYEILEECVSKIQSIPGLTCELGVRRGGGSEKIMRRLYETGQQNRVHIGIDPYGNIEYETAENTHCRHGYTNEMLGEAMIGLYTLARSLGMHFLLFPLEDTEFFNRFPEGVPLYNHHKVLENRYALVHFDGPHALTPLRKEFQFFNLRSEPGAVFVFDDIQNYPHDQLETNCLFPAQWRLLVKGSTKAAYQKHSLHG